MFHTNYLTCTKIPLFSTLHVLQTYELGDSISIVIFTVPNTVYVNYGPNPIVPLCPGPYLNQPIPSSLSYPSPTTSTDVISTPCESVQLQTTLLYSR